jgi:hypothetical protein
MSDALAPPVTPGFPLVISGGQKTAHCPEHADRCRFGPQRKDCLVAITEERKQPETPLSYSDATTRRITADNAIEYAYRELGEGDVPLVLLQHFRGNLDNWARGSERAVRLLCGAAPSARGDRM